MFTPEYVTAAFPGADLLTSSGVSPLVNKHGKHLGWFAMHRIDYALIKAEQIATQKDRRVAGAYERWERKQPQNRIKVRRLRNDLGQVCGYVYEGPLREPTRPQFDDSYRETVLEILRLVRRPYRSRTVAQAVRAAAMPLLRALQERKAAHQAH